MLLLPICIDLKALWSPSLVGNYRTRRRHADSDVLSTAGLKDVLERVHWKDLTVKEFEERYERPKQPVVVTGLCDGWHAGEAWTEQRMMQRYGEHKFKVQTLSHEVLNPNVLATQHPLSSRARQRAFVLIQDSRLALQCVIAAAVVYDSLDQWLWLPASRREALTPAPQCRLAATTTGTRCA